MKWYIVVKIFAIVYTSIGPYDTRQDCTKQMTHFYSEAKTRYAQGERLQVYGLSVKPQNVKGQCKLK